MRSSRFAFLVAVALASSCTSTDVTTPTVDVNALVDQTGVASYTAAALSASVPGVAATVPVPSSSTSSCTYSATNQRFGCAPVTVNGLTITRSYALLDAAGHPLSVPNPTALAAIHSITDLQGTLAGTGTAGTMTIVRHEDATLSDLLATTHLLNGTATQKLDFAATGLTFSSNETSTTANLRLPAPTATAHWPLGGTITTDRTMTVSGVSAATTSHEVLSFDGTTVMTLTRTSGTVTTTCKFDLSKPTVLPVCS